MEEARMAVETTRTITVKDDQGRSQYSFTLNTPSGEIKVQKIAREPIMTLEDLKAVIAEIEKAAS